MINPLHPLARGLVGCWIMNEGTGSKLYDLSGKNNHGTLTNMAVNSHLSGWAGSGVGRTLSFDGDDDAVIVSDNDSISGLRSITCSCWIYTTSWGGGGQYPFVVSKSNGASQREYRIRFESYNSLVWHISNDGNDPGSAENRISISGNLNLNTWHHIVGTYDTDNSNLLKLYVDGVLKDTDTGETGPIYNGSSNFSIGGSGDIGPNSEFFGKIDNVRVYNRALSADEVKRLFYDPHAAIITPSVLRLYSPAAEIIGMIPRIQSNTKPLPGATLDRLNPINDGIVGHWLMNESSGSNIHDISGKNNHGILKNMSTNDQSSGWSGSKFGGGLCFDGTDDNIDCGNDQSLSVTTGFSVSVWIKPAEISLYSTILSKMITDDAHSVIYFYIYNNQVNLRLYDSVGAQKSVTSSTIYIDDWYHVVGTYDGSDLKLYVNGVLVDTELTVPTINMNTSSIIIGANERWPEEVYQGIIDNVKMYKRGLSHHKVKQMYEQPFTGIQQPSLYSTTAVAAGWTGMINGITNPAYINGVSVADILKVNGVASST